MLLKAAMAAPSACNLQPWSFIVVDEEPLLSQLIATAMNGDYPSPLAIVVCGIADHIPWEGEGWRGDCGMAAQNILLEATELGLASVCIGGFDEVKLKEILTIPDNVYPMIVIEIGYPDRKIEPKTRYDENTVHCQHFDTNKQREMRTIEMLREDAKKGII